jgi:hypothetical protein
LSVLSPLPLWIRLCGSCHGCQRAAGRSSGVQELVPLLFSLQPLDSFLMHLLGELLVSLALLLCGPLVLDSLYATLEVNVSLWFVLVSSHTRGFLTCRSSSFSSFISFSFAFMAAVASRSCVRFSYDLSPAPGRKAFRGACHCLPVQKVQHEIPKGGRVIRLLPYHCGACPGAAVAPLLPPPSTWCILSRLLFPSPYRRRVSPLSVARVRRRAVSAAVASLCRAEMSNFGVIQFISKMFELKFEFSGGGHGARASGGLRGVRPLCCAALPTLDRRNSTP